MKVLCVNILNADKFENLEVDHDFNGKVVEGFNVESYNKNNDKVITFIPKETFVKVYEDTIDMIYPQAMNLLITGLAIRRRSWADGTFILKVQVMGKPSVFKFYEDNNGNYRNSSYTFLDDDVFATDYEIYLAGKHIDHIVIDEI